MWNRDIHLHQQTSKLSFLLDDTTTMMAISKRLLSLSITVVLLPWNSVSFAHPALPISNARPSKKQGRFAPGAQDDASGTSARSSASTSGSSSSSSTSFHGKSTTISGTPFRGIARRLSSTSSNEESLPPASQLESIVANAKSLSASLGEKMDLTNPTLRTKYLTAMTAGLAVSLAMVPEAVSFSCKYTV